jgi:hypothetical protein
MNRNIYAYLLLSLCTLSLTTITSERELDEISRINEEEFGRYQDIVADHELTNRLIILPQAATTAKGLIVKLDADYKQQSVSQLDPIWNTTDLQNLDVLYTLANKYYLYDLIAQISSSKQEDGSLIPVLHNTRNGSSSWKAASELYNRFAKAGNTNAAHYIEEKFYTEKGISLDKVGRQNAIIVSCNNQAAANLQTEHSQFSDDTQRALSH